MSAGNPLSTMMRSLGCVIQSACNAACLLWPTVYTLIDASVVCTVRLHYSLQNSTSFYSTGSLHLHRAMALSTEIALQLYSKSKRDYNHVYCTFMKVVRDQNI